MFNNTSPLRHWWPSLRGHFSQCSGFQSWWMIKYLTEAFAFKQVTNLTGFAVSVFLWQTAVNTLQWSAEYYVLQRSTRPDSLTYAHAAQHWPAVNTGPQKCIFPALPSHLTIVDYICFVWYTKPSETGSICQALIVGRQTGLSAPR